MATRKTMSEMWREGRRQFVVDALRANEFPYRGWDKDYPDLERKRRAAVARLERRQTAKKRAKNPGFFSKASEAGAKRVKRVHLVREIYTGEIGELVTQKPALLKQGWVKVKWRNRDKPTLIQKSEITPVKAGTKAKVVDSDPTLQEKRPNPAGFVCCECGASVTPMGNGGHWKKAHPGRAALRPIKVSANPSQGGAGAGATSSDVRSPTRTEVRSPTKTSTVAHTRGNITVTGGAGAGATTSVKVIQRGRKKNPARTRLRVGDLVNLTMRYGDLYTHGNPYIVLAIQGQRIKITSSHNRVLMTGWADPQYLELDPSGREKNPTLSQCFKTEQALKRKLEVNSKRCQEHRNPSVNALAETFQGRASGATVDFKASDSAPANLARIGKLVFLKLRDVRAQISAPGAMVAVDTRGKLWLVGGYGNMFSPKAKAKGEALDYGEIDRICYLTAKEHIGNGKQTEYVHTFGEDGGKRPRLLIDHDGMPILRGGDYQIRAEGIVN